MQIKISREQWNRIGKIAGWAETPANSILTMEEDAERSRARTVRVTFDDGDIVITGINGTKQSILDYYMKREFTKQDENTKMHAVNVEFLE